MNVTAPGIAAWTLVTIAVASAVFAILNRRSPRRLVASMAVIGLVIVGLVVVTFAQMGAFCDPPPGSACL